MARKILKTISTKITGLDQEYFILKEKIIELDREIVECEKFILKLGDYSFISLDKNQKKNGFGCLINQSIPQNPPLLLGYWENNFIYPFSTQVSNGIC